MIDGRRYTIDAEDGHRHLNPEPEEHILAANSSVHSIELAEENQDDSSGFLISGGLNPMVSTI